MIIQKIKRLDDDPSEKPRKGGGATDERAVMAALARASGKSFWHVKTRAKRPGRGGANPRPAGIHAKDFRVICEYLIEGKSEPQNERPHPDGEGRVEDAFTINLPTSSDLKRIDAAAIREAEKWMGDTAALNTRIRATAVLHYVIALPTDEQHKATPAFWRDAGARVLSTLDMSDHQALFVVHKDADHPHMHIVVNRVHPTTFRAVSPFQDMVKLEGLMRQIEKQRGLRKVTGRLINPATGKRYTAAEIKAGERPGKRKPRAAMAEVRRLAQDHLKADKPFTHAASWTELEQRLAKHGYTLRAEGAGLMLSDAEGQSVKVSEVAGKGLGRRKLEERFGSWSDYQADKKTAAVEGVSLEQAAVLRAAQAQNEAEKAKVEIEKRKIDARALLVPMLKTGARILVTSEDLREPVPEYLGVALKPDEFRLGLQALSPEEISNLYKSTQDAMAKVVEDQRAMAKEEGGRVSPAYYGAENAWINLDAAATAIKSHARALGIALDAPPRPSEAQREGEAGKDAPKPSVGAWKPMLANNPDISPREIAAGLASFDDEVLLGYFAATKKAARELQALKLRDGNTPERALKSLRMAAAIRGLEFALKGRGIKVPQNLQVRAKTKSRGMEM